MASSSEAIGRQGPTLFWKRMAFLKSLRGVDGRQGCLRGLKVGRTTREDPKRPVPEFKQELLELSGQERVVTSFTEARIPNEQSSVAFNLL